MSVLGNVRFETVQSWDMYVATDIYSLSWLDSRFNDILEQNISEFNFNAVRDEQGYIVTLTVTLRGV